MKPLPSSPESERALMLCMVQNPALTLPQCLQAGMCADWLEVSPQFQTLFAAILEISRTVSNFDIPILVDYLRSKDVLEACGGYGGIVALSLDSGHPEALATYLEILREKWQRRQIIRASKVSQEAAWIGQDETGDILSALGANVARISGVSHRKAAKSFREMIFDKMDRLENSKPDVDVVQTGLVKLDLHSPLRFGAMPLVCGERKAGKSILANTIAAHVALDGWPVAIFSLEDPTQAVVDRLFSCVGSVSLNADHVSKMTERDIQGVDKACRGLGDKLVFIEDSLFDLGLIVSRIRQLKTDHPDLRLVVIDYAQLVRASGRKDGSREQEVALVSRTFRLLAMELMTPILLLSQLNEHGASRESRALEQDATACWKIKRITDQENEFPDERFICIPWQRNGKSGINFKVTFQGEFARVQNHSGRDES